jgi:hypothetical protein
MRPFISELWKARRDKPIEFATLVVTVSTVVIAVVGGLVAWWQLAGLNQSIRSQAESYLDQVTLDFDKVLIDNADDAAYLQRGEPLPSDLKEVAKIQAIATMQLDYFDSYYGQRENLGEGAYQSQGWTNYISASFKNSGVLCDVWKAQACQHSHGVEKMARKNCPAPLPSAC